MAIHWFTEQDRQEMRETAAERARDDALFTEFFRERYPDGIPEATPSTVDRSAALPQLRRRAEPDDPA